MAFINNKDLGYRNSQGNKNYDLDIKEIKDIECPFYLRIFAITGGVIVIVC